MARRFAVASQQLLINTTSSGITGLPLTVALRSNQSAFTTNPWLVTLAESAGSKRFGISTLTTGVIRCIQYDGTTQGEAQHGTAIGTGAWGHVVAVFASATSRSINYNNLTKVTNTTNVAGAYTPDQICIGAYDDGVLSASNWVEGDLAEVALWNVALDDDEQAAYMKGVSPVLIRPQSLVRYFPLYGQDSPERNHWKGACDLTLINTPTKSNHPRVYYPAGPATFPQAAVAVGGTGEMFLVF